MIIFRCISAVTMIVSAMLIGIAIDTGNMPELVNVLLVIVVALLISLAVITTSSVFDKLLDEQ